MSSVDLRSRLIKEGLANERNQYFTGDRIQRLATLVTSTALVACVLMVTLHIANPEREVVPERKPGDQGANANVGALDNGNITSGNGGVVINGSMSHNSGVAIHNSGSGSVVINGGTSHQSGGHSNNSSSSGSVNGTEPRTPHSPSLVEAAWALLQWGSIAFDTPMKMSLEHRETVSAALSPKLPPAVLERIVSTKLGRNVTADEIKTSSRMRAELIGPAFTITSLVPEEQAIRFEEPTHWKWIVTPMESGDQSLHLNLYAVLTIPDVVQGKDMPMVLKTYDRTISINVSNLQRVKLFLREHWQWIVATVLIPLVTFVVTFIVDRFKKQAGSAKPLNLRFVHRLQRGREST